MLYPLEDIKVVDLSRVLAGPYCTMLLGDLGADIIKIEPPGGDESRKYGPPFIGGESYYFMSLNRNKKSIVLDLKSRDGVEVLERLVKKADVVVENFRPGVTKKLGIDYLMLKKLNSSLIYCSITGFGQTGPYAQRPGYDIVAYAMGGMMSITGEPDQPPVKPGVPVADIGSGMFAVNGILAALLARKNTGKGQSIDVALLDGQVSWLTFQAGNYFGTGVNPSKMGSAHPTISPYQAFKAEDSYFILAVGNDGHWKNFCKAVGQKDLMYRSEFSTNPLRVENRELLVDLLESLFVTKPAAYWLSLLRRAGVPCGNINNVENSLSDSQVIHRGMVQEMLHPRAGKIKVLGVPFKLSSTPGEIRSPPPILGEHTDQILKNMGYGIDKISQLRMKGAVA